MSGTGIELSPVSHAPAVLPSPDLLNQFKSNSNEAPEAASNLAAAKSIRLPFAPSAASLQNLPVAARAEPQILGRASSKATHAEAAVRPQNALMHPLAHVRYKAPVDTIGSLVGLKQHIAHYFHLYHTELAIIAIIFLDVLAVCCEIMLESVCPHQKPLSDWTSNLDATYVKYDKAYHLVHDWETALGWTSKAILFLFLIKEALLIFAVGFRSYFTKGPHIIDFLITAIAFALEMGFFLSKQYSDNTQAATLTHLITVLLVWRVVRLLHGLLETTMAVQNHDAALNEKELLQLNLKQSKDLVNGLQERVRQLEASLSLDSQPIKMWSLEELQLVRLAFEKSKLESIETQDDSAVPAPHNADAAASQHDGAAHAGSINRDNATFRADHFCSWLTTDPEARGFGVNCRVHAVACGAALLASQMIEKNEVFSKLEALAGSCHILPASHSFEDNHSDRYRFVRGRRESNHGQVQHV